MPINPWLAWDSPGENAEPVVREHRMGKGSCSRRFLQDLDILIFRNDGLTLVLFLEPFHDREEMSRPSAPWRIKKSSFKT